MHIIIISFTLLVNKRHKRRQWKENHLLLEENKIFKKWGHFLIHNRARRENVSPCTHTHHNIERKGLRERKGQTVHSLHSLLALSSTTDTSIPVADIFLLLIFSLNQKQSLIQTFKMNFFFLFSLSHLLTINNNWCLYSLETNEVRLFSLFSHLWNWDRSEIEFYEIESALPCTQLTHTVILNCHWHFLSFVREIRIMFDSPFNGLTVSQRKVIHSTVQFKNWTWQLHASKTQYLMVTTAECYAVRMWEVFNSILFMTCVRLINCSAQCKVNSHLWKDKTNLRSANWLFFLFYLKGIERWCEKRS